MKKRKDRAAVELGKRRWQGVSAEERTRHAREAVAAREQQRKETQNKMQTEIMEAHLPTWLKLKLLKVSQGERDEERSYAEVGWHLGFHHLDDFDVDRDQVPDFTDEAAWENPSATLRRVFANEEHPRGDLIDYIPMKRRREFLRGLLWGAEGNEWDELVEHDQVGGWASHYGRK